MTKRLSPIVAAVLILAMLALGVACGQAAPAPSPTGQLPERFVFAMSGAGKSFNVAAFMSDLVTKYTTMKGSIERVTSPAQALTMIADGQAQSAIYSAPSILGVDEAKRATLRALFCGAGPEGSTVAAIQTTAKSGIKTVTDLKGKRVYAENPALIFFGPMMDAILKTYGMTRTDFKWQIFSNADDAFRDLKEGRVDAMFYVIGTGSQDLAESPGGLFAVPLSQEAMKAVEATGLGYVPDIWPKGTFGNTVDTPTVSSPNVVWSSPKMTDDVAYAFTKVIFEHIVDLQKSQKAGEGYDKKYALASWVRPYHPGAIKYLKEAGIWKAENDKPQADLLAKFPTK